MTADAERDRRAGYTSTEEGPEQGISSLRLPMLQLYQTHPSLYSIARPSCRCAVTPRDDAPLIRLFSSLVVWC